MCFDYCIIPSFIQNSSDNFISFFYQESFYQDEIRKLTKCWCISHTNSRKNNFHLQKKFMILLPWLKYKFNLNKSIDFIFVFGFTSFRGVGVEICKKLLFWIKEFYKNCTKRFWSTWWLRQLNIFHVFQWADIKARISNTDFQGNLNLR